LDGTPSPPLSVSEPARTGLDGVDHAAGRRTREEGSDGGDPHTRRRRELGARHGAQGDSTRVEFGSLGSAEGSAAAEVEGSLDVAGADFVFTAATYQLGDLWAARPARLPLCRLMVPRDLWARWHIRSVL